MRMMRVMSAAVAMALGGAGGVAWADGAGAEGGQEVRLKGVREGVLKRYSLSYAQVPFDLSEARPASLKGVPEGLVHSLYGVLPVGNKALGRTFHIVIDSDGPGKPWARAWVDTNGNGDLTDDPKVEWKIDPYKGRDGVVYDNGEGWFRVDLGKAGEPFVVRIGVMAPDPKGAEADEKRRIYYWADYGRIGRVTVGDRVYEMALLDEVTTGDFSGQTPSAKVYNGYKHVYLNVDRNGNGRFDGKGERFSIFKPFNLGGVTYEVADVSPAGDFFRLVKSTQTVPELPVPAVLEVGKPVPSFEAPTLDGRVVRFPDDFKKKVVLLEYWATWCGPCMAQVPKLREIHATYHGKGLEVVGISGDDEKDREKVIKTVKENGMVWTQVFDAKAERSELFLKYGVGGIPQLFLVDGDTGVLLDDDPADSQLAEVIERALKKKEK